MKQPEKTPLRVLAAVAAGGALGAAARYGLELAWPAPAAGIPWATLVVNVTGCALLGALLRITSHRPARHRLLLPFLGTGVLGGFTTYSTYVVQGDALVTADRPDLAAGYLLGTLLGALAAGQLGWSLAGRVSAPTRSGPR